MKRWLPTLATLGVLLMSVAAHACPMCKDSIPNNDGQSAAMVPGAVNNSIFLMFAAFISALGMITWTLVKGARSARPRQPGSRGFPVNTDRT
jgi:di/tricarboxylate transporter